MSHPEPTSKSTLNSQLISGIALGMLLGGIVACTGTFLGYGQFQPTPTPPPPMALPAPAFYPGAVYTPLNPPAINPLPNPQLAPPTQGGY